MNQQLETSLDQLFSQWQNGICPGVQALIRQSGQTLYEKSFGYANLEHQIPITSRTIFHVASISKQFTVLSVLLLWKDGRLDLDDDIRRYVGDLISFEEPMTIRQMMNNVSGLRDQWELLFMRGIKINDAITSEDVNSVLKGQRHLNFPPQSAYLYSNMGFSSPGPDRGADHRTDAPPVCQGAHFPAPGNGAHLHPLRLPGDHPRPRLLLPGTREMGPTTTIP